MKLKFNPWIAAMGLLLVLMILAFFNMIPIHPFDIFWLVITVACVWAIMKIFFSDRKK